MDRITIQNRVEALIDPIVSEEGVELLEVVLTGERGRTILRVVIDREEGGITLDDCTRVSHAIEDLIEVEGSVPVAYELEVSSPGIDRPLKKRRHFERVKGKTIRVKTIEPIEGRQNYKGILTEVNEGGIVMEIDRKEYAVRFDQILKADLEGDFYGFRS